MDLSCAATSWRSSGVTPSSKSRVPTTVSQGISAFNCSARKVVSVVRGLRRSSGRWKPRAPGRSRLGGLRLGRRGEARDGEDPQRGLLGGMTHGWRKLEQRTPGRTRTCDLRIRNPSLYPPDYRRIEPPGRRRGESYRVGPAATSLRQPLSRTDGSWQPVDKVARAPRAPVLPVGARRPA